MQLLRDGARAIGLNLTAEHLGAFESYYQELSAWNHKFNLTTVTQYEEVQLKHFLDSLTCLLALPSSGDPPARQLPDVVPLTTKEAPLLCIDVGTGAGLPGLAVKILRPTLHMTLLDASRKKTAFLQHVIAVLGLVDAEALWARAEDVGQDPVHRERYDVVLARAVADLAILVEYCLPLCRVGGRVVAQKGAEISDEAQRASHAIETLGGSLRDIKTIQLPGLRAPRSLVLIDKVDSTPLQYPRRAGMPHKQPLIVK